MPKRAADGFNSGFLKLSSGYAGSVRGLVAKTPLMLAIYAVLIAATAYLMVSTPKGFIPVQDRGYLVVIVQLPDGASLERTNEISQQIEAIALDVPGWIEYRRSPVSRW